MGSRVMAQKYISGAGAINEQFYPYRSADFTEEVGAVWGRQQERTPDYFVTYYLIRREQETP
jgi:hypothetical protein